MLAKTISFIENEYATVSYGSDGILYVKIKAGTHVTTEVQDELIKLYNSVTSGKKVPFLFEGEEFVTVSKDALENSYKLEEQAPLSATALIVKNLAQKILADFYYKFKRPNKPLKVFKNKDEAKKWLAQYL